LERCLGDAGGAAALAGQLAAVKIFHHRWAVAYIWTKAVKTIGKPLEKHRKMMENGGFNQQKIGISFISWDLFL
jgi:hypothetical protein